MASLKDIKVSSTTVDNKAVASLPDNPSEQGMSALQLKEAFDALPKEAIIALNALIDYLLASGASDIGVTEIKGLEGKTTMQTALEALKSLVDTKQSIDNTKPLVKNVEFNENTGVFTFTKLDGSKKTIDTRAEKIPVSGALSGQTLELTLVDGTKLSVDLSALFSVGEAKNLIKNIEYTEHNGTFIVTKYDGSKFTINTAIEKIALDVRLDGQQFVMTLVDGTEHRVDLSAFIEQTEVKDSDTVTLAIESGKIVAKVKEGSVTVAHLSDELAEFIQNSASGADWNAAEGETGHVKNRTHWKEILVPHAFLVPETDFTFNGSMISISGVGTNNILEGSTYIVTWNGTAYECTAHDYDGELCLGNSSLIGSAADTGEPFVITTLTTSTSWVTKKFTNPEVVKLCVERPEKAIYHTLDPQYFPTGLIGEKGDKGDPGADGEDGADGVGIKSIEQTTTETTDGGVNVITVTLTNGNKTTFAVRNGSKGVKGDTGEKGDKGDTGAKGATGSPGVNIQSVQQTVTSAADGGTNEVTVTLDNGTKSTFSVRNGSKGSKGDTGAKGDKGDTGEKGDKGDKGDRGATGATGPTGVAGYTPVKGTDYWTEEDKNEMKLYVEERLSEAAEAGVHVITNADMAENNEAAIGYVKNRTHWKEVISEKAEILPNTTVSFKSEMSSVTGIGKNHITEGVTYIVTWNGKKYECIAHKYGYDLYLGNSALVGDTENDTGEPFTFEAFGATSCYIYKNTNTAEDVTFRVETPDNVVYHKLDGNYLPEGLPYTDGGMVEILPETQPIRQGENEYMIADVIRGMEVGGIYTVTYNGVEYECSAAEGDFDGITVLTLGNGSAIGFPGVTDDPFFAIILPEEIAEESGGGGIFISLDDATSVTLSISGNGGTVHKLDNKYLDLGWIPNYKRVQVAAEKTVTPGSNVPKENEYGFPDLNASMVYEGQKLIIVWNGTEYKATVVDYNGMLVAGGFLGGSDFPYSLDFKTSRTNVNGDFESAVASVYALEPNKITSEFLPKIEAEMKNTIFYGKTDDQYLYKDRSMTQQVFASEFNQALKSGIIRVQFEARQYPVLAENGTRITIGVPNLTTGAMTFHEFWLLAD